MGQPIGNQYIPGENCSSCFGSGKAFGDIQTPKEVFLIFGGLTWPFSRVEIAFIAIQNVDYPCFWSYADANWMAMWSFTNTTTTAQIVEAGFPPRFLDFAGGPCETVLYSGAASAVIK